MRVLIVVDQGVDEPPNPFSSSTELDQAITALKQAIVHHPVSQTAITVEVIPVETGVEQTGGSIASLALERASKSSNSPFLLCPLTLNLPRALKFPGQAIYSTCRDIPALRQWVEQNLETPTGEGTFWLPIVLTAKGALYAEVIGVSGIEDQVSGVRDQGLGIETQKSESPQNLELKIFPSETLREQNSKLRTQDSKFQQPVHLSDRWRQPLYRLGQRLLKSLSAPPSVYLLQFGFQDEQICFDRLFPFPAAPAIGSIGIQTPDLFTCYWCCLTYQPILDLVIGRSAGYRVER